jgi:hypothetical protein
VSGGRVNYHCKSNRSRRCSATQICIGVQASYFPDTRYLHKDHLGSVDTITDEFGAVVLRLSFDAFGKRRGSAWSGSPTAGRSRPGGTAMWSMSASALSYVPHIRDTGFVPRKRPSRQAGALRGGDLNTAEMSESASARSALAART